MMETRGNKDVENCKHVQLKSAISGDPGRMFKALFTHDQEMLMRTIFAVGLIAAALLLCLADRSVAAEGLPSYARLADIPIPGRPMRIAVDASGNFIVGESGKKYVSRYAPDGALLGRLALSSAPTAIKASSDGLLYIGLHDKIEIYHDVKLLRTVTGISRPASIEVSSTGTIYALDADRYCITIISPAGDTAVWGDHNSFGSDLRDMALDELHNELYVLDRNQVADDSYVWRVQVFDLQGNLLRSFSHYGYATEGTLVSASSLVVDEQRRVYVADNVQNIIGVFDYSGNYLGSLHDTVNPYYNPVDMAYRNDRLYVTSFLGNKVTVLGLEGYADLAIVPQKLDLKVQGSSVSGDRTVRLNSTGNSYLLWSAVSDSGWLSLSKASGSIGGGLADEADVAVNTSGLDAGKHTGTITFTFNGGSKSLGVTVDVLSLPVLTASPASLALQADAGTTASRQATIELSNDLSGTLTWTAASDSTWLGISPASGLSNALTPATITINTAGLASGIYRGQISVSTAGRSGSPSMLSVDLTVIATNTIQVVTNNADAIFSISGPQSFKGSGTSWSASNIADGTYTIAYGEVSGLKTPMSEALTVAGGNTIIFNGNYWAIRPESIIATQDGRKDTTTVKIFDIYGSVREFVAFEKMLGGLVTAVGDLDGDGVNEIAATIHNGRSRVGVFDLAGRPLATFAAFTGSSTYDISTSDLDNDGLAELIVSKSSGAPAIRVLSFNYGNVIDTGIDFMPYEDTKGSNLLVAAGDIDGDGITEIVTVLSIGRTTLMRIWAPDTADVPGAWSISLKKEVRLDMKPRTSLTGLAVKPAAGSSADNVMIMRDDGSMIIVDGSGVAREVSLAVRNITDLAAGDVNGDGNSEIITGMKDGTVKVFTSDGTEVRSIKAYKTKSGVRVSAGIAEGAD